jgi:hypothetical protein
MFFVFIHRQLDTFFQFNEFFSIFLKYKILKILYGCKRNKKYVLQKINNKKYRMLFKKKWMAS